ncbi:putative transcriptional regulator [Candidatus Methanoperedens nitroreducens]|uniref:Putative transcriptional regulator n=1 Tax=Candidatus Methanoperedens nitratireducens TaxID=1392998 RepID=A0A062VAM6_9EURY|nr:ArsR family transcriptional regulator [Candidatus Methanoperedens nitroreducens]KCZ73553.1 putative transcriptional regulator [Candidatus Methanoperedens nitroreducens]MDJ1422487.1 ArsR family transcriptional regulator [Candidatus Methanoperedens sp.]
MDNGKVFIELLADKYSSAIMALTSQKECSALQLNQELNIPLSTVYRKLKLLENANLIQNVKTITDLSGNVEKYYRCTIHEARVGFHDGKVSISLDTLDYKDKFVRIWKRLSKPEG